MPTPNRLLFATLVTALTVAGLWLGWRRLGAPAFVGCWQQDGFPAAGAQIETGRCYDWWGAGTNWTRDDEGLEHIPFRWHVDGADIVVSNASGRQRSRCSLAPNGQVLTLVEPAWRDTVTLTFTRYREPLD